MLDKMLQRLQAEGAEFGKGSAYEDLHAICSAVDAERLSALQERNLAIERANLAEKRAESLVRFNFCDKCRHAKTQLGGDGGVYDGNCLCDERAETKEETQRADLAEKRLAEAVGFLHNLVPKHAVDTHAFLASLEKK